MIDKREILLKLQDARRSRRSVLKGAASVTAVAASAGALSWLPEATAQAPAAFNPFAAAANTGPSSKPVAALGATPSAPGSPYIVPAAPGWHTTSLLTAGNEVNGYRLAGIPDGVGALDNGDRTITIVITHEIRGGQGATRGHGGRGAFVSSWVLHKDTLAVLSGKDLCDSPQKFHLWSEGRWKPAEPTMGKLLDISRLCSADLAPLSAFYNAATKRGYNSRLFLTGEEAGLSHQNRAFAYATADGSTFELPDFGFGKAGDAGNPPPSWENLIAHPTTGDQTVVMATSDGGSNQAYIYLGSKRTEGNPVEKAGLAGGKLYSLLIQGVKSENRETNIGLTKSLVGKGQGARLSLVKPNEGTSLLRPEDGVWDVRNPNLFYFVTTDRNNFAGDGSARDEKGAAQIGRSRLWAITFDDVQKIATDGAPTAKIEMLLDGTEGGDMFDNVGIDASGFIYLCEDPGNSRRNGKIWTYEPASGRLTAITKFDPAKFGDLVDRAYTPPVAPFVDDKETSGIVDVTDLFSDAGWFKAGSRVLLCVVQAHFNYDEGDKIGAEIVQGGQLLLLAKSA